MILQNKKQHLQHLQLLEKSLHLFLFLRIILAIYHNSFLLYIYIVLCLSRDRLWVCSPGRKLIIDPLNTSTWTSLNKTLHFTSSNQLVLKVKVGFKHESLVLWWVLKRIQYYTVLNEVVLDKLIPRKIKIILDFWL
jgi:hypothetical protein